MQISIPPVIPPDIFIIDYNDDFVKNFMKFNT